MQSGSTAALHPSSTDSISVPASGAPGPGHTGVQAHKELDVVKVIRNDLDPTCAMMSWGSLLVSWQDGVACSSMTAESLTGCGGHHHEPVRI